MDSAIVLDYGSKTFKAGYAYEFPSDEAPRLVIPNAVEVSAPGADMAAGLDGTHAPVHFPVQHGRIANFDEFEALLHYILYELAGWIAGEEGSMIVAEPLLTPKADREMVTQLMFEVFNVNGFFAQDAATLSLYAVGRLSGCVIDIGHGKADVATVLDGQLNTSSVRRFPIAGEDLTRALERRLARHGAAPHSTHDVETLKELCSRCLECASDFDILQTAAAAGAIQENGSGGVAASQGPQTFRLPDGQEVTVTPSEQSELGEVLFQPHLLGHDSPGLPDLVYESIWGQTDILVPSKKTAFESVMLCGGGAAIQGLPQRLLKELRQLSPPNTMPALCGVPEYLTPTHTAKFAPWIGGAVLAKTLLQQNHFVSKGDYEEAGPLACHRKCS